MMFKDNEQIKAKMSNEISGSQVIKKNNNNAGNWNFQWDANPG